jgi:hypothetical protein
MDPWTSGSPEPSRPPCLRAARPGGELPGGLPPPPTAREAPRPPLLLQRRQQRWPLLLSPMRPAMAVLVQDWPGGPPGAIDPSRSRSPPCPPPLRPPSPEEPAEKPPCLSPLPHRLPLSALHPTPTPRPTRPTSLPTTRPLPLGTQKSKTLRLPPLPPRGPRRLCRQRGAPLAQGPGPRSPAA